MQKVVLVFPPLTLKELYGELSGAGSKLPPQGLCSLSAVIRENKFKPVIIDSIALGLNLQRTIQEILKHNFKYIGISAYSINIHLVKEMAEILRGKKKDIKIIVGGGQVSVLPKETMEKCSQFDIGVMGEGEFTFLELLNTLETNGNLENVKGISFRKDSKIIQTEKREFIENLDILPLPAWDLLPRLDKYYYPAGDSIKKLPSTGIVTSRGCPGKCYFCNRSMFGNKIRENSADYIVKMIKDLKDKYRIKDIYIQDDTFVAGRQKVIDFCQKMIKDKVNISWSCHGRTNLVDLEMLKIMRKAGCWQIAFGIESGAQEILNNINKETTVEMNKQALNWCKESKLAVKGLFMMGNFGETKDTIKETISFIKTAYMTDFHMTFFTPMPATVSWKVWEKYGNFTPNPRMPITSAPAFIPLGFTREELIKYQKLCYKIFYLRAKIIWYFFLKLLRPGQTKRIVVSALHFFKYTLLEMAK